MNCRQPGSAYLFRPAVEQLESRHVPSTIGTPTQNFVDQVYLDLLHHSADVVGLSVWTNRIDSRAMSRSQVVLAIEQSPEGRSTLVNDLFLRFLHHSADTQALMAGSNFLAQGNSTAALEAQIIGSAEYLQTRAGGVDQFFLAALYSDVLNRAVDPVAAAADTQALNLGVSPARLAFSVLTSPEGRTDQVRGYYTSYLRRPADPPGLAFWTTTLEQLAETAPNPDMVVVAQFLGSAEYFPLAQTPIGLASIPGPA